MGVEEMLQGYYNNAWLNGLMDFVEIEEEEKLVRIILLTTLSYALL